MPGVAPHPRLQVCRAEYKDTKNSAYCPTVRQLCHVDATNRIPPPPPACPSCDHAHGLFIAFLTYKTDQAGMWLFKCSKCQHIHRPAQLGPSPVIADAIRKQLEANAMAACEVAAERAEEEALKIALVQSKRESQVREKALRTQENALKSIDRMRTQAHRQHDQDVQKATRGSALRKNVTISLAKISSVKDSGGSATLQRVKAIIWFKGDEKPLELDIEVNLSRAFYLTDHDVFAGMWNGIEVEAFVWCIDLNAWNHGMDPLTRDAGTRIILIRQDFIGHCLGFGTELRVLQATRSVDSHTKTLAAIKAKKKEIFGQVIPPDMIRLVFWHDDHEVAMEDLVFKYTGDPVQDAVPAVGATFLLTYCTKIFDLLRARKEATVDVFIDKASDWERFEIRAMIPLDDDTHTVLIRIPGVQGMPFLGVEIEALRTPRTVPKAKRVGKDASALRERKRRLEIEEQATAYLAQWESRSRSSSVESWHPGSEVVDASTSTSNNKGGRKESSSGTDRGVLGERNAKRVKVMDSDARREWEGADTVVDGRTMIDLTAL